MIQATTKLFPVWAIVFSCVAYVIPSWFSGLAPLIPYLLGMVMLGMGLTLKGESFRTVLTRPRTVLTGVALPDAIASPAQRLFTQGYRYAFPLTVRGRKVGVVVSSHRFGDLPLSSNDLDLIRQLLNQASLAIEKAVVHDPVAV